MKKISLSIVLGLILISFAACSPKEEAKKVDLASEFQNRPYLLLTLEDGTVIEGFEGNYCTDVVCMEPMKPDFSQLNYTPVSREAELLITVETTYAIESVRGSLFKKDGTEFFRDLSFIEKSQNVYTLEGPLQTEESEVTLHVKVNFGEQGLTNYYFPLNLS